MVHDFKTNSRHADLKTYEHDSIEHVINLLKHLLAESNEGLELPNNAREGKLSPKTSTCKKRCAEAVDPANTNRQRCLEGQIHSIMPV